MKIKVKTDEIYYLPLWTFDLPKLEQHVWKWWRIEPETYSPESWVFDPLDYTLEPDELNDLKEVADDWLINGKYTSPF